MGVGNGGESLSQGHSDVFLDSFVRPIFFGDPFKEDLRFQSCPVQMPYESLPVCPVRTFRNTCYASLFPSAHQPLAAFPGREAETPVWVSGHDGLLAYQESNRFCLS